MSSLSTIQWWCAARGAPWDWSWQSYPGVWIALIYAAVALKRTMQWRLLSTRSAGISALILLWLTLDWPAGPLGAGYLASVHAVQFVMLAMVIPALWLFAVRNRSLDATGNKRLPPFMRILNRPLMAAIAFTLIMTATHLPLIVDALMASQAGSFALDALWLASGFVFWNPVLGNHASVKPFPVPMQMLYLFFGTQIHLLIAMWLLTADFPVYATYELAPRITSLSALQDQQVAGGVMLLVGAPLILAVISVLFFRWINVEDAEDPITNRPINNEQCRGT